MRSLVLSHIRGHLDDNLYKEYKYKLKLEVTQEHDISTGETINKLYICNSCIFMFLEYIDNLDVVQNIINGKGIIQYTKKVLSLDECNELYPYLSEDSIIEVLGKNYRVFEDSMRLIESQDELEEVLEITKQRCYDQLISFAEDKKLDVDVPYKIGSVHCGVDWDEALGILCELDKDKID